MKLKILMLMFYFKLPGQCFFLLLTHCDVIESSLKLRNDLIRANRATLMTTYIECVRTCIKIQTLPSLMLVSKDRHSSKLNCTALAGSEHVAK